MKHIKLFESYIDDYLRRKEKYSNEEYIFQNIINLLEKELNDKGILDDIVNISKSKTDFGQSWYIIFNNGREIRISDHSVTSNKRILDTKYLFLIDINKEFTEKDAKEIVEYYLKDKLSLQDAIDKRNTLFDEEKNKRNEIEKSTKKFIDKLKMDNKGIFNTGKTYINIDELKIKHPDWELIFQEPCQNAFAYTYVKNKNGYEKYYVSNTYYEFLMKNNVL